MFLWRNQSFSLTENVTGTNLLISSIQVLLLRNVDFTFSGYKCLETCAEIYKKSISDYNVTIGTKDGNVWSEYRLINVGLIH
jgi:hypothetical protein